MGSYCRSHFSTWDKHSRLYFTTSQNDPIWACGSHFKTCDKNSWSCVIKLWFNSFIVTSRVISHYVMNSTADISYHQKIPRFLYTKWHSECRQSPSMRSYGMVRGSHFSTWNKHSRSYFIILWYNSPFVTRRDIVLHVMIPTGDISLYYQGTPSFPSFRPENGIGTAYIYYRWDRIARCVGVIFQHEINTPGFISINRKITPHARFPFSQLEDS